MAKRGSKSPIKRLFSFLLTIVLLFGLYVVVSILHATMTEYKPEASIMLQGQNTPEASEIGDSSLSFLVWNIGYGGLGAKSDFFYDDEGSLTKGQSHIRPSKTISDEYFAGITKTIADHQADFYLLQEVDVDSKRGHHRDQLQSIQTQLPDYGSFFAVNYDVKRVPLPVLRPWDVYGRVKGGLASFTKYNPDVATRLQLPGNYSWPTRVFQLDRCVSYHEFPTTWEKKLVVMNIHNSAYDSGGKLKKQQMDFIKDLAETAYQNGHYVVIGGDWNQTPPHFNESNYHDGYTVRNDNIEMDASFFSDDWRWIYDPELPTNRSAKDPYQPGVTPVSTIDYFLISPNVQALSVKTVNLDFAYSDHQPVSLEVLLK